ncbi:MAG: LCP family protein, partial [Clostridia bacterium]|nr:LCP family protein [Clostridia bacterium]
MKSKTRKKKGCLSAVIILLIAAVVGVFLWSGMDRMILVPNRSQVAEDYLVSKNRINVLVLGTDSRAEDYSGRSDSIMVFSLDLKNKKVNVLSIPRDSRVEIPGKDGKDKINHAFARGGLDLTIQTVENLLKVPIDYYAITDFQGFEEIIDVLGGIEIDVDKRMYYHTDYGTIDLQEGLQTLNGENALGYVRYRHDAMGDIARAGRQQIFMKAVMEKMLEPQNVAKLPTLLPAVMNAMETDLTTAKLLLLAKNFAGINMAEALRTEVMPGDFANYGGISYWEIDEAKMAELIPLLFNDIEEKAEPD